MDRNLSIIMMLRQYLNGERSRKNSKELRVRPSFFDFFRHSFAILSLHGQGVKIIKKPYPPYYFPLPLRPVNRLLSIFRRGGVWFDSRYIDVGSGAGARVRVVALSHLPHLPQRARRVTEARKRTVRRALEGAESREEWIRMMAILWPSIQDSQDFAWELLEGRLVKEGFDAVGTAEGGRRFAESLGVWIGQSADRGQAC